MLARGLCGLSALDLYSLVGDVGFEITSSEVRNLWAVPVGFLWALTYDYTVGFELRSRDEPFYAL